ncbi:MAG: kynurenine formamidase, partial [Spartobacteria bacterium]|nr:kynurenine formamidase [Spartobacteria bacterium]
KLLGLDLPSVDHLDAKVLQNHHALAGAGIVIVESLELNEVEGGVYNFVAFPLKIAGGDGSPVRAILWRE